MKPKDIFCFHRWKEYERFEPEDKTFILYRCVKCGAMRIELDKMEVKKDGKKN